jgi:hypothetical protein
MPVVTRSQAKIIREKKIAENSEKNIVKNNVLFAKYKDYAEFSQITTRLSRYPAFSNNCTKQCVCADLLYSEVRALRVRAKNAVIFVQQSECDTSMMIFAFNLVNRLMRELKVRMTERPEIDKNKIRPVVSLETLESEVSKLSKVLYDGLANTSVCFAVINNILTACRIGDIL